MTMLRLPTFVALSALLLSTHAFKLTFYKDGSTCDDPALGTWIGGEGQGCRQDFVGVAGGVLIESTGAADNNTRVVFYRTAGCDPVDEIAQGDAGCIGVANEGLPEYLSFNVVAEPTNPAVGPPPTARGLSRNQKRAYTMPNDIQFVHGARHQSNGKNYRMHQVDSAGFFVIPEEEWDDAIHIQNEEDPPLVDESLIRKWEALISPNVTHRDLEERAFNFGTCRVALNCAKAELEALATNVGNTGVNIAQAAPAWLANVATRAAAKGLTFIQFMDNHPFLCNVVTGVPLGFISWVAGRWGGSDCPGDQCIESCSSEKDQIDALQSAVAALRQSQLAQLSAVTITITETVTNTPSFLSLSTIGCDQRPLGDQCNILSGYCQPNVGSIGTTTASFDKLKI